MLIEIFETDFAEPLQDLNKSVVLSTRDIVRVTNVFKDRHISHRPDSEYFKFEVVLINGTHYSFTDSTDKNKLEQKRNRILELWNKDKQEIVAIK